MKKHLHWFTLMELLVVMMIIAVIALSAMRINFGSINDKQKSEILAQKLIGRLQTLKNYSTTGHWVWASLYTPELWQMEIWFGTGGTTARYLDNWWVWQEYSTYSYKLSLWEVISNIRCVNYFDNTIFQDITTTGAILFWSGWITFSWCPDSSYNILKISVRNGTLPTVIEINSMNGVVQKL